MQHVHYDLDKIERDTRAMFANAPGEAIHEDPAVVDAFRRSADVEVAFGAWLLGEIMRGTDAEATMHAVECIMVNLIMNRMRNFGDDDDGAPPHVLFMHRLVSAVFNALNVELERGRVSDHGVKVSPVVSGQA